MTLVEVNFWISQRIFTIKNCFLSSRI